MNWLPIQSNHLNFWLEYNHVKFVAGTNYHIYVYKIQIESDATEYWQIPF